MNEHLLFFYGEGCSHCKKMEKLVQDLKKEGIELTHIEVWNNEDNAKMMESLDKKSCGGIPFFINTKTEETICGEVSYKKLKKWAIEK